MKMVKWIRPSGLPIEVADGPEMDKHAEKMGWKREDKIKRRTKKVMEEVRRSDVNKERMLRSDVNKGVELSQQ